MARKYILLGGMILVWLVLIALAISFCSVMNVNQGGQYKQIGEQLGTKRSQRADVQDYKYVADPNTMQYWPNLPEYVDRIPGTKVWIIDDAALAEFKGYKPGPL